MKRTILITLAWMLLLSGCSQSASPDPYPLDGDLIAQHTQYITETIGIRPMGSEKDWETAQWLEDTLVNMGYETVTTPTIANLDDVESQNVIAIYNSNADLPLITIVAHYDSIPTSVGAGDNAVAVGILLEIARHLQQSENPPPCQIDLVFLGGEETGYHGSRCYVESLSQADRSRLLGAYNMDISAALKDGDSQLVCTTLGGTVDGAYLQGDIFSPVDNPVSRSVQAGYERLYDKGYGGLFHTGDSDHISFHESQLNSANVCWRGTGDILPLLPPTYHQPNDTWDTLDYDTAVITGRCVLAGIDILLESQDS